MAEALLHFAASDSLFCCLPVEFTRFNADSQHGVVIPSSKCVTWPFPSGFVTSIKPLFILLRSAGPLLMTSPYSSLLTSIVPSSNLTAAAFLSSLVSEPPPITSFPSSSELPLSYSFSSSIVPFLPNSVLLVK